MLRTIYHRIDSEEQSQSENCIRSRFIIILIVNILTRCIKHKEVNYWSFICVENKAEEFQ